ncbi:MAG: hypothetical protein NTW90_07755 [Nitrosospira sp.]|nr:hypothetical protein [Nitrosospira sp.]
MTQATTPAVLQQPPSPSTPRVPPVVLGVNVNHCKNPYCSNFTVPVAEKTAYGTNPYTIVATAAKTPAAKCNACGEIFGLKSNQGVFEEAWRIIEQTYTADTCPDSMCDNHRVPTHVPKAYQEFGVTKAGSKRYRCKKCSVTFSVKPKGLNPIARQQQSDKNRIVMAMLVGRMPLRRICEAADIAPRVLYERIDFFHEQSLAFLAERERNLSDMEIPRLYLGVDRQDHVINWSGRKDKRNVTLSSVAAADNATGYVFGMHPNFDPGMDPLRVEALHKSRGEDKLGACHRGFARLWLESDYDSAVMNSKRLSGIGTLPSDIATTYANGKLKADIEAPEIVGREDMLPQNGMLVHAEYTLHGFFLALRKMFSSTAKVRFFLDQDSGMRAACLSAFANRIKDGSCDAFYVRIAKDLTIDEKRRRVDWARGEFDSVAAANPSLDENGVKLLMLKDRIAKAQTIGPWKDRWVFHPLPTLSEADKAVCHLTDMGLYDPDHLAWLYNKASLHAVDSFFNRIRRRSSMLERPVISSANRGRVWNAYSAYRPEQINKIQTIIRACHNYVWTAEGKKAAKGTPATRLGLAKAPLDLNDIIYFR